MNALEAQLDYPLGDALPARGETISVAPAIRWARMGLPFALDHINVWLVADEEVDAAGGRRAGWTIVDCGIDDAATRADWDRIFAGPLAGEPVLRVVVTHMHPDHIGCAHWLCERFGVRLWISATDFNVARVASSANAGFGGPLSAAFMAEHGMAADPKAVDGVGARSNYYRSLVPSLPESYRRLLDGGRVEIGRGAGRHAWVCHAGYGHAPEHISLHDEAGGVLISGDMVLPRISTNVSVIDVEPEADSLRLYLDSLERMRSIPAETLVLPSHGRPFRGLHTRIDQLQEHHEARFADVLDACASGPRSAFELVPVIFRRPLDLHQMTFAMGESIAHLHALWFAGKLERRVGDDRVIRFVAA
jgi:glyoxylase-like metal-dependent hydrolase (beta-lactamase superfamily II)